MYVLRALRLRRSRNLPASLGVRAAIAVGASLGVLAAPAAMAAPANDTFANRTDLGDQLPVHEIESNVGSTSEAFDSTSRPSAAPATRSGGVGNSPGTEWVTVSTCQTAFPTVVASSKSSTRQT